VSVTSGAGTPTGTVTFFDGNTAIGTGTVANGTATFTTGTFDGGSHNFTAVSIADHNFAPTTSDVLIQGGISADTATGVPSSASPSVCGQSVTFTATVSTLAPGVGTANGTVTFTLDSTTQTVTLVNGAATLPVASLSVGTHSVTAAYNGVSNFNASTST